MALIFQRLARNFVKNGYFPTDADTLDRIVQALGFTGSRCKILDPCCGEGTALAEIKHALASTPEHPVEAYGVEYDSERAWHAKQLLDFCIHGDLRDCMISARQYGLLFLNPPYGDAVADKGQLSDPKAGRLRLEKEFYRRTNGLLQFGGVLVLIVPYYVLDEEFSSWIATHFHDVKAFMAPEQQFKQSVVFGIRHKIRPEWTATDEYKRTREQLVKIGRGDITAEALPETWNDVQYVVPEPEAGAHGGNRFELVALDGLQLADTLGSMPGLWKQHDQLFNIGRNVSQKRPLCDVSNWHLALMLAAGQVSGVVRSKDGRVFVVRGDTYKDKQVTTSTEPGSKGQAITVRTHTDIFVPAIRGLDMTPGSKTLGEVFTIR